MLYWDKAFKPSRGAMGIIQGFDRILIQFAIFWTREVHPLTQFHQAVHTVTWHGVRVQVECRARELRKTTTWIFSCISWVQLKCHWHGLQKLVMPLHRGRWHAWLLVDCESTWSCCMRMMLWCSHVQNRNDSSVICLSKLHKRYQHQQTWQPEHNIINFTITPIGTPLSCLKCVQTNHEMRVRLANQLPRRHQVLYQFSANPKEHKEGFWRLKNAGQWDIKSTQLRTCIDCSG